VAALLLPPAVLPETLTPPPSPLPDAGIVAPLGTPAAVAVDEVVSEALRHELELSRSGLAVQKAGYVGRALPPCVQSVTCRSRASLAGEQRAKHSLRLGTDRC